jgi:hypothetical protein
VRLNLLLLYPRAWQARYADEVSDLLAADPPGLRDRLDLVRGAMDAHLHPARPSLVPPIAALTGGALWTVAGLATTVEPAVPDWPGYSVELLPLVTVATVAILVAIVGTWLRVGDAGGRFGLVALDVAVVGHLGWLLLLGFALARVDYGASTALAADVAAVGTALVALTLLRSGDWIMPWLLAVAAAGIVLPAPIGWLAFGLAWSAIGFVELRDRALRTTPSGLGTA